MLDCDWIAFIITYSLSAISSTCYVVSKQKRVRHKTRMKNKKNINHYYMNSLATTHNEKM